MPYFAAALKLFLGNVKKSELVAIFEKVRFAARGLSSVKESIGIRVGN